MSLVYFIREAGGQGPVKIGFSVDPVRRCKSMEACSPVRLEIIASMPGGYALEHRLQNYFATDHSHSEWFHWSPRMASVVEAIRAGAFDEAILPNNVGHVGGKPRGNPGWKTRVVSPLGRGEAREGRAPIAPGVRPNFDALAAAA